MAIYADRDIKVSLSGDLEIDTKGDLALNESPESHVAAAHFLLKTDNGDYAPNPSLGANLGSIIGEPMLEENLDYAEGLALRVLQENVYSSEDIAVTVIPLDQHSAGCIVEAQGTYLISGQFKEVEPQVFIYDFPFIEGSPTVQVT